MPQTNVQLNSTRWDNPRSEWLLLVFPGVSGIGTSPGYKSLANWFWLHAYNVILCHPPGSNEMKGEHDMATWLENGVYDIQSLRQGAEFQEIDVIGACAGGAVATHLLMNNVGDDVRKGIALFETPLRWSPSHLSEFKSHAIETGIRPSERCCVDLLDLADAPVDPDQTCLFAHGDDLRMPFTEADLEEVKQVVPSHKIVSIGNANHGLLKRGPCHALLEFCEAADYHFQTHGI